MIYDFRDKELNIFGNVEIAGSKWGNYVLNVRFQQKD